MRIIQEKKNIPFFCSIGLCPNLVDSNFPFRGLIYLLFLLLFSIKTSAQSNQDTENWNPGYLVTMEEDTIYGPVLMNFQNDLVQLNEENMVKTYASNQLKMVYYRDNENDEAKYFYTFKYHPYSDFKPYRLFEMIFSGIHLCLLAREMLVTETVPYYDSFSFRTYYTTRTRLAQEFYFMFPGEKVKNYSGGKKELLSLLADQKEEIKKFLTINKISFNQKEDLIKVVKEYNRLKTK